MKKFLLVVVLLSLVGGLGVAAFLYQRDRHLTEFAQAPFGSGDSRVVLIPPGTGPRSLAALLFREGVVSSAEDFYAWQRREQLGPRLKAGEYEFTLPVTPREVAQKLISGQQKLYRVTIPEGLRVDEVLPLLAGSDLHLNLDKLTALSKDTGFIRKVGVPARSLEGFLFPDTYSFTHGYTEESVLTKMVTSALEQYRRADAQRKPGNRLSLMQAMTLASIVEKESGHPEDRSHVACVFHNRLRLNMKLQTDPTVLYAMMLLRGKFIKNITARDLVTDHPYNTYTRFGLPPGPIANPGAAALAATLNPPDCKDLYFVSRNDGTTEFCPTLLCHNAAVKRWQQDYWKQKAHASK